MIKYDKIKLTSHFSLTEMLSSDIAEKKGIDNTPGADVLANLIRLCNQLETIRREYGKPIYVSSGYRSKKLNTYIKGAQNSDHLFGCACDIIADDNAKLWECIIKCNEKGYLKLRQIINEYGNAWIHVSINHEHNSYKNNQILYINEKHN